MQLDTLPQWDGWWGWQGTGGIPDGAQNYRTAGDYGVIGAGEGEWRVVFASDGVRVDPFDKTYATPEDAMDAAERLGEAKR